MLRELLTSGGKRAAAGQILAYGYRNNEIDAPLPDMQDKARISQTPTQYLKSLPTPFRRPMMCSIGAAVPTALMPHVDLTDGETYLAGAIKRVVQKKFRPSKKLLRRVRAKAMVWAKQFSQIDPCDTINFEDWLKHTKYPEWRKEELRKVRKEVEEKIRKLPDYVGSFGKDEQYSGWKHLRTINARPDEWKVMLGPYIHAIEKKVFRDPSFAKYVPVDKRFAYLKARLYQPGAQYQWTDHSAFESVFTNEMVEAITLPLYEHVFGRHEKRNEFLSLYKQATMPRNGHKLVSKFYTIEGGEFECSGEMDTSLKNGAGNKFSNDQANALTVAATEAMRDLSVDFVLRFFASDESVIQWLEDAEHSSLGPLANTAGNVTIALDHNVVCEGDDGIEVASVPTHSNATNALGFTVKMEVGHSLSDGDFCCVDGDVDTGATVTNPIKVLGHFGWLGERYVTARRVRKLELLRARALSQKASYPDAPVIGALADYVLRVTSGIDMKRFFEKERRVGQYRMERFREAYDQLATGPAVSRPTAAMRAVVESRYGVLVSHQLLMEQFFREQKTLVFLDADVFKLYMPNDWVDYAARYTVESKDPTKEFSPLVMTTFDNFSSKLRARLQGMGVLGKLGG